MTEITHERCSELLGPYSRGELARDDERTVEEHLVACEECPRELAGLRALAAAHFEPLRDEERSALHGAVLRGARPSRATVSVLPAGRTFWERHAGQVVGAAASLVIILFAVLVAQGIFGGGDDSAEDAASGAGGGANSAQVAEGPPPVFAGGEPQPQAATEDAVGGDEEQAFRSALQEQRSFTENSLARLGRQGKIFRTFAREYTAEEAFASASAFLEQLATAAPTEDAANQVRTCGSELLAGASPENPMLPAYGSLAEVNGRPALILGFVTTSTPAGALERYTVWAVNPTNCDDIVATAFGDISG